jgi:hypothetical protein
MMASENVAGVMHGGVMLVLMNATSEFDPRCDFPGVEESGPAESIFRLRLDRDHSHD